MNRGSEYDWTGLIELANKQMVCGYCGVDVASQIGYTGWFHYHGQRMRTDIYVCHNCSSPNYYDFRGNQHPTYKLKRSDFSTAVEEVSPRFVKIYNQAQDAEEESLDEISGPGFGKALEFLVKDYLIKSLPEEEEQIKKLSLYNCIHEKLDNPKIKTLADRARVIRNDETHYERKYEQSDVNDLKKLISATAAWIELETFTAEVAS